VFSKVKGSNYMLTVGEVARILKVHKMTILRHIYSKDIKAVKIGQAWRISEKELERIKEVGV
jgi:excisionase family DNA binding protein